MSEPTLQVPSENADAGFGSGMDEVYVSYEYKGYNNGDDELEYSKWSHTHRKSQRDAAHKGIEAIFKRQIKAPSSVASERERNVFAVRKSSLTDASQFPKSEDLSKQDLPHTSAHASSNENIFNSASVVKLSVRGIDSGKQSQKMRMGQGDHSKQNTITIKVPDPIVTFLGLQLATANAPKKLQKEIQEVILGASKDELPPDYWINARKLFGFLDNSFAVIKENIQKYASEADAEDVRNILSQLEDQTAGLRKSFESLLQDGISNADRNSSTLNGLGACQNILSLFADRNGMLFTKSFLTSAFLVTFAALYKSFSKMWGQSDSSRQRKEMERLQDTILVYKAECIRERLDNIKMLRTQSESFNVHDYSYEAQIRKDVAFGGTINDYYDKRSKDQINYVMAPLNDPSDADNILAAYKNAVKMEYELFFLTALREPDEEDSGPSTN